VRSREKAAATKIKNVIARRYICAMAIAVAFYQGGTAIGLIFAFSESLRYSAKLI